GYGEGAPDPHYGESVESAMAFLGSVEPLLGDDPLAIGSILSRVGDLPGEMAAKAALDGALHDLLGKICGQPLWRILGLEPTPPPTSYTISIDTVEGTADRARRAAGYHALKIKTGGPGDLARVRVVREQAPDALIRVDANEAWSRDFTRQVMWELVELGVELVEQPLPAGDREGYAELHAAGLPLPIVIDEACHTLPDVAEAAFVADGVNIKLTKSGGIREALRMIHAARALDLRVMLGCMNESSLGIAQAVQLSPLVDVVDLDGHLLNRNDAFSGLGFADGRVLPSDLPGLGVTPLDEWP
ncbi:MAG TPA: dipeptide epimerase, partial [Gaiellales bacterium]|nr:dipeptide epimerase [Gaiellales bacterium]